MKNMKKRVVYGVGVAVLAAAGVYVFSGSKSARADFDPSALATVERGTMVKSVVATGKVEPITKVEIKSKANGIIEALRVDVGTHRQSWRHPRRAGQGEPRRPACAKSARTSRPPKPASPAPKPRSRRTSSKPKAPTSNSRGAPTRAPASCSSSS